MPGGSFWAFLNNQRSFMIKPARIFIFRPRVLLVEHADGYVEPGIDEVLRQA